MEIVNLVQGTPEWHAHRAAHYNASDAPAMMSVSPYKTRSELVREYATGLRAEVGAAQQRIFDNGHRYERLAQPLTEKIVGQQMAPLVGTNGKYSASFDNLTFLEDIASEHKSLNDVLRAAMFDGCTGADLPEVYQIQMEHQCLVAETVERVLFMASKWAEDGTLIEERHCWYTPNLALRARIVAGWDQFEADVAAYVPDAAPTALPVVAAPVTALPAVSVQVSGAIAVTDNFKVFEEAVRDFIDNKLIRNPETDQDFANLDSQIKAMKNAEAALDAAEVQMLSQVLAIDERKRTKEMLHKLVRDNRLIAERLLSSEKDRRRGEIVADGMAALRKHVGALHARLGVEYVPLPAADFGAAIKGKKNLDNMREAVEQVLTNAKIEANEVAARIEANLQVLRERADLAFLFPDERMLALKAPDDLAAAVKSRVADHEAKEAKRLEAERERIRAEEAEKAQREQAERNRMALSEIQGIQQQVMIASIGRAGVRKGGTIECIRETLAETEAWLVEEARFGAMHGAAQAAKDTAVAQIRQLLTNAEAAAAAGALAASQALAVPTTQVAALPPAPEPAQLALTPVASTAAPVASAEPAANETPAASGTPTLKIGAIAERLGFSLTAEQLRGLGIEPATRERGATLYHEHQFPQICEALARRAMTAKAAHAQRLAA
ncbi:endonuclease [Variovorax sp.]|uniref:endonuclease n=1 Tax=Variovorax sp. TaxID=1871043 RepID=UPI003BA86969